MKRSGFRIAHATRDVDALIDCLGGDPTVNLVILDDTDEDTARAVAAHTSVPIAMLAQRYERSRVTAMLNGGIRAYIEKSLETDAIMASLRLTAIGEAVLPSAYLDELMRDNAHDHLPLRESSDKLLSNREQQILQHLTIGSSNKMIARELAIAEATVKVHVKALLRKLNVRNRTQAAIVASHSRLLFPAAALAVASPDG